MSPWPILGPLATVAVHFAFVRLHARRPSIATLPVVGTTVVLIALLATPLGDLNAYERGTAPISWLLGPATVALAVPLARHRELLRRNLGVLVIAVAVGAIVGAASAVLLARLLGLDRALVATLSPKSVTTPMAMPIAERLGGVPPLTAAIVVLTGVLGMAFGPALLDRLGVRSPLARGVALGTAAHGVGTARALAEGPSQGAAAGVSMVVAGVVTAIVAPLLVR